MLPSKPIPTVPSLYGGWPVRGGCVISKQSSAELCVLQIYSESIKVTLCSIQVWSQNLDLYFCLILSIIGWTLNTYLFFNALFLLITYFISNFHNLYMLLQYFHFCSNYKKNMPILLLPTLPIVFTSSVKSFPLDSGWGFNSKRFILLSDYSINDHFVIWSGYLLFKIESWNFET